MSNINIEYRELELKYLTSCGRPLISRFCSADGIEILSGDRVQQIALKNDRGRFVEMAMSEAVVLVEENGILYLLEADQRLVGIPTDRIVKVPEKGNYFDVEFNDYDITFHVVEPTNGYTGGETFFDKLREAYNRAV